jgi:thiosulfate/3-mercaptopyruvate sulfurtransferase
MSSDHTTLIQPQELQAHLTDARWRVFDCRFDLTNPAAGRAAYRAGHIPGAIYAHLDEDLSSPVGPTTGRHPLPDPRAFAERLGAWGVSNDSQVVAYDAANGAYAARLWWLLRWLGHHAVAVLDGGLAAWQRAGLPLDSRTPEPARARFIPHVRDAASLTTDAVADALADGEIALIDARGADRFAGRNETLDPIAGHVPGARNHPLARNLDADNRFLPAAELHRRWLETLGGAPSAQAVCMCGSGVTACHALLSLEIAGLSGARLYPGSWSEWIRDPSRPAATGD